MRKQIDFAVRVWKLTNGGSDGGVTGEQLSKEIRELYLANGYEVFDVSAIQVSGFAIMYHVAFVKWEEIQSFSVSVPDVQTINVKSK